MGKLQDCGSSALKLYQSTGLGKMTHAKSQGQICRTLCKEPQTDRDIWHLPSIHSHFYSSHSSSALCFLCRAEYSGGVHKTRTFELLTALFQIRSRDQTFPTALNVHHTAQPTSRLQYAHCNTACYVAPNVTLEGMSSWVYGTTEAHIPCQRCSVGHLSLSRRAWCVPCGSDKITTH